MADTIREQIITAMMERFRGISKLSGYNTDLGASIYHFRAANFEAEELQSLNIIDAHDDIVHDTLDQWEHNLDIELEIKAAPTTLTGVYELLEDVYEAIAKDDTWGGLAFDTQPSYNEIDIEHAANRLADVKVRIRVKYSAAKWAV